VADGARHVGRVRSEPPGTGQEPGQPAAGAVDVAHRHLHRHRVGQLLRAAHPPRRPARVPHRRLHDGGHRRSRRARRVGHDEWHLPLVDDDEIDHDNYGFWLGVSAGRCARVSYDRHNDSEDPQASWDRADKLLNAGPHEPVRAPGHALPSDRGQRPRQPVGLVGQPVRLESVSQADPVRGQLRRV
jgi:hypothetical protein